MQLGSYVKGSVSKAKGWFSYHRDLYPSLLTLVLFMLYGSSIINGIHLASNVNSWYWVGSKGYAVCAIPVLVVVSHVVQAWFRRPMYFAVLASCIIPPLLSAFIGYQYMNPMANVVGRLQSTDCVTFRSKLLVEQAYKEALTVYTKCVNDKAKNTSKKVEVVKKETVITQCPDYNPQDSGYAKEWEYLQGLEKTQACSGWCFDGEAALWTHNPLDWDSCSLAAAQNIHEEVVRNAWRMVVNAVIGFAIAGIGMFLIQEWINNARSVDPDLTW